MKAVILAGGQSKRLHPMTINEPKCLLEFEGRTMLSRYLDLLEAEKIDTTFVVTGFNHEAVKTEINSVKREMNIETILNTDFEKEDNHPIHGFFLTKNYLDDDFLLLNSDIYFTQDTLDKLIKNKNSCVAVDSQSLFIPGEMFVNYDSNMIVSDISKSLQQRSSGQGKSVQVVKILKEDSDALFERVEELCGQKNAFYPAQAYDVLIKKDKFFAFDINGEFSHELDTVEDYHSLREHLDNK
ncbi:NTP transferase domain-containing protein [Candidatus Nomurabacteria bacterium]|nr:NTP transferase domain-containing protein [Candidatus Kaiserbacteria bacterium]MCB9815094.1 NTP transferase domain-containing protein [Candidatus Nomurabacteria bacterium]